MNNIPSSSTNGSNVLSSDWTNTGAFRFLGSREKVVIIESSNQQWEIQLIKQGNIFQRLANTILNTLKHKEAPSSEVVESKKFNPSLIVKAGILKKNIHHLFKQTLAAHQPARKMYQSLIEGVKDLPGEKRKKVTLQQVSPEEAKLSNLMSIKAKNTEAVYRQPTSLHPFIKLLNAKTDDEFVAIQRSIRNVYPAIFERIANNRYTLANNAIFPNELDKMKEAVKMTLRQIVGDLSVEQKGKIYGEIYNRRPQSDEHPNDNNYGEHHVFDDPFKLIMILQDKGHLGVVVKEVKVWEGFEKEDKNRSRTFTTGNTPLENGVVGYVNGKDVDFNQANEAAANLLNAYGIGEIRGVFNAPQNADARTVDQDVALSLVLAENPQVLTPATRLILEQWNEFFRTHRASEKFLQICHGEGSLHVKNALEQLPPELKSRICILSVNPTYYIEPIEGTQIVQLYKVEDEPRICYNKNIRDYIPHCKRVVHTTSNDPHPFVVADFNSQMRPYIEKFKADGELY